MLTKELIEKSLTEMPNEFTFDEILEEILLIDKIQIGLEQAEKGEIISEEELDVLVESW